MPTKELCGRVVRSYSNVYYVDVGGETLECRPRGRLKYRDERVVTGDLVTVSPAGPGLGAIDQVRPRKNVLLRPPVSNVDQVVVVFAFHEPELDLSLVDRFLVLAGVAGLQAALCLNKVDLARPGEEDEIRRVYGGLGYPFLTVSARTGENIEALRRLLAGRTSVLAGPSGAGKSSLINTLQPALDLRTGDVSAKVRRGTHTTRHVSLLKTGDGGFVADTPGFTQLESPSIKPVDLAWFFPEMACLSSSPCRFRGCLHRAEPGCAVKAAVASGSVDKGRYERYLGLLKETEESYRPW